MHWRGLTPFGLAALVLLAPACSDVAFGGSTAQSVLLAVSARLRAAHPSSAEAERYGHGDTTPPGLERRVSL
jgi:hypothetical protein